MNETLKTIKDWNLQFIINISFKTIAFSEGALEAHKKNKNRNIDDRKIPNP
jgi:hypothetical protein